MKKRENTPPKGAVRFFRWYCRNELRESILGDLHEQFLDDVECFGQNKARFNYRVNVLRFFNRHTIKRKRYSDIHQSELGGLMFANYLKTSFRYLRRQKIYSFITIGGLSIGLACCLLIFYFLNHELSYDNFHNDSDNIYRIGTYYSNQSGDVSKFINTPPALATQIRGKFPELEKTTRLRYSMRTMFSKDHIVFYEQKGFFADSVFLDIFDFELESGNKSSALDEPNSIVMTEETARKYFRDSDPVGQTITMNNDIVLKVTGVLKPVPTNSHIQFDYLISFPTYKVPPGVRANLSSMRWLGFLTYVKLADDSHPDEFKNKLDKLYDDLQSSGGAPYTVNVQPLKHIYLGSDGWVDDLNSGIKSGSEFTVYSLAVIALLILFIAGFNFMNMTTAVSVDRGKEIGLRKVLGANKKNLIFQMLNESIVIAVISLVFAYAISLSVFPYVKSMLGWDLIIEWKTVLLSLPAVFVIVILMGILARIYPSVLLSRLNAVTAFRGRLKFGSSRGLSFGNLLIVLQFCISIGLIVSTIVIIKQINLMKDKSLGFDKENVVELKVLPENMNRYYDTFKNRLLQNSGVISVSKSGRSIGDSWPLNPILVDGKDWSEAIQVAGNWIDYDYLETMKIPLKQGRTFSKEYAGDSLNSIVINETAARALGLDNPVGQKVHFFSFNGPRTIIGVTEDFNFSSLHNEIIPAAMIIPFIALENMYVRIAPGNLSERVELIENTWQEVAAGIPLDIRFMDDNLDRLYRNEEQLSYLITGFSTLAVILACLGLYGMVTFMVNSRMKEVGIRKVLGASVPSLIYIFSRQYILLIIIASIVAVPGMQYVLNKWLNNFAYRIEITGWMYLASTLVLLLIALFTISHQTLKAVFVNPVEVLKSE